MPHIQDPPRTCDIEPFVAESTPQSNSPEEAASAGELFQQQIQNYLNRFKEAICDDLQPIVDNCCLGYLKPVLVTMAPVNIPSIPAGSTVFFDLPSVDTPIGTHIISWATLTDSTSLGGLVVSLLVVATDTVRLLLSNNTAAPIDPTTITFQLVKASAEDT